jgi:hypothetical protein
MSSPNDVLKDHRRQLIQRLVNRSPLLRFLPGSTRQDLFDIFKEDPELPNILSVQDDKKRLSVKSSDELLGLVMNADPQPGRVDKIQSSAVTRIRKILNEVDDYRHTTGQHSCFIAYPLLYVPTIDNRYIIAPVFLWPILPRLERNAIIFERLEENGDQAEGPIFNRILQAWLKHEYGVDLNIGEADEDLSITNIAEVTRKIFSQMTECKIDVPPLVSCGGRDAIKSFASKLKGPQLLPWCMWGHAPFKGQALLDDLDNLEEIIKDNPNDCGLLKYFLFPNLRPNGIESPAPVEDDKWLITDTDVSQEKCVWQARNSDVVVIQGPPGTGKSQTIVNIIADGLEKGQSILLVCQKRAALDVVLKRIVAAGLGELAEIIEEPAQDRLRIIRGIKSIESDFDILPIQQQRSFVCSNISECDDYLYRATRALNYTNDNSHPPYRDLLSVRSKQYKLGYNVSGNFQNVYVRFREAVGNPVDRKYLNDYQNHIKTFTSMYLECDYENNPWRDVLYNNFVSAKDYDEASGIAAEANNMAQMLIKEKNPTFYNECHGWLAEHEMGAEHFLQLISKDKREFVGYFVKLARLSRRLRKYLPDENVKRLIDDVRNNSDYTYAYGTLEENCGWLQNITEIKRNIYADPIIKLLFSQCQDDLSSWNIILDALVYQSWLDKLFEIFEELNIQPQVLAKKKDEYADHLNEKKELDILDILKRYSHRLKRVEALEQNNLLRLRKGGGVKKTTLRRLFKTGYHHVSKIRPLILTNPETVSSIYDLQPGLFDLLIIDEASQMYVSDALPILYRSKKVVISGDSMQMPPSDFFVSSMDDEDVDREDNEIEEEPLQENQSGIAAEGEYCLLDAAERVIAVGRPGRKRLQVHYRSENKELIDFSNYAFYDGSLLAPSGNSRLPSFMRAPIHIETVNGTFIGGINENEAKVIAHTLRDIWRSTTEYSVGVIVFNVRQREYLVELLDQIAESDPEFSKRLSIERERKTPDGEDVGFFVRSVEHVQGDERDIIIMGTTYSGNSRNYGPISRKEKGRRRLNVAVTRAKRGMYILTSLNIDAISNDIQKEDTENYYLWKYMCYARAVDCGDKEEIYRILNSFHHKPPEPSREQPDSEFEIDVAEFLRRNNYHVDYQIGESGFRIDLGVKKPKDSKTYLCGIECDGRIYHSGWKARENDIWRQRVLETKGWKIVRIWSTDWYRNAANTQKKLLEKLFMLQNQD